MYVVAIFGNPELIIGYWSGKSIVDSPIRAAWYTDRDVAESAILNIPRKHDARVCEIKPCE